MDKSTRLKIIGRRADKISAPERAFIDFLLYEPTGNTEYDNIQHLKLYQHFEQSLCDELVKRGVADLRDCPDYHEKYVALDFMYRHNAVLETYREKIRQGIRDIKEQYAASGKHSTIDEKVEKS